MGLFCVLCFFVLGGDEIFFYEVEAVKFLDGQQVDQILNLKKVYTVEFFFSFENELLRFVSRPEKFPTGKFWQNDVQFKFGDDIEQFLMQIFELAVSKFGNFGFAAQLVCDFQYVHDFIIEFCLVIDDFGFEIEHQSSYLYICQSNNNIIRNIYSHKKDTLHDKQVF